MDMILVHPFLNQKGGGDRVILDIAKKFNPVIHSVIYEPDKTFSEFREFDIRSLPKNRAESAFLFLKNDSRRYNAIRAGLRFYFTSFKESYDVISAHGTPSEWIRNKNPRVCWTVYSPSREAFDLYEWRMAQLGLPQKIMNYGILKTFRTVEFSVVPKIERLCAISEVVEERIRTYLHRDDAEVIHPGVDPNEFTPGPYERFFLLPSRLVPEKQLEFAISAFKIFSAKKRGWKLVIAGFLPRGNESYLKALKQQAGGLNVEFRVNPPDEEYHDLFSTCFSTLFCALNEDWGLTPLESMACEKPCISINEGGPRYSILDGKTGFLVNTPEEMAERMNHLAMNPELNEEMGKAGRRHVIENFTTELFLRKLEKSLKTVSGKG